MLNIAQDEAMCLCICSFFLHVSGDRVLCKTDAAYVIFLLDVLGMFSFHWFIFITITLELWMNEIACMTGAPLDLWFHKYCTQQLCDASLSQDGALHENCEWMKLRAWQGHP